MGKKGKRGKSKQKPKQGSSPRASDKKSNDSEVVLSSGKQKGKSSSLPGLSNLGNTCFFNAVMQNIGQSHFFRNRLSLLVASPSFTVQLKLPRSEEELKLEVVGELGQLTTNLHNFLATMQTSGGRTLNPRPVFQEISKKGSQFAGYHKQDSQELLRYLLDSLRNEEIDRIKRAILKSFGVSKTSKSQLTDAEKAAIRGYGMQALMAQTFVDDVFGGMLVSTVTCTECGSCTTMKETFLDLSLPIAEDKTSGSHQMRDKKNQNHQLREKNRDKDGDDESFQETEKMSKHQRNKLQKESKKPNKKRKLKLNDFLKEDIDSIDSAAAVKNADSQIQDAESADVDIKDAVEVNEDRSPVDSEEVKQSQSQVNPAEASEGRSQVGPVEVTEDQSHVNPVEVSGSQSQVNPADVSEGRSQVDPATGEPQLVADEPKSNLVANSSQVMMADSSQVVASSYASSGPQVTPTRDLQPAPSEQSRLAEGLERLELEDSPNHCQNTSTASGSGNKTAESAGGEELHSPKLDPLEKRPCEPNSLLFSLDMFCAVEHLTGDNKFACAVCTKELLEKRAAQKEKSEDYRLQGKTSCDVDESEADQVCGDHAMSDTEQDESHNKDREEQGTARGPEDEREEEVVSDNERGEEEQGDVKDEHEDEKVTASGHGKEEQGNVEDEREREDDVGANGRIEEEQGDEHEEEEVSANGCGEEEQGNAEDEQVGANGHGKKEQGNVEGEHEDDVGVNGHIEEKQGNAEDEHEKEEGGVGRGEEEKGKVEEDNGHDKEKEKDSPKPEKSDSKIAFCDATKQILIQDLPQVLTLHLKRFSHQGRKLKKNNRHIVFPAMLDLSPFCTKHSQELHDTNGRVMYSLYGVVVHSGGMQDGHYTAYTKTRPHLADITTRLGSTHPPAAETEEDSSRTGPDPPTPMEPLEPRSPSGDREGTPPAAVQEPPSHLEFDYPSVAGQWYFASDTHVRTVTEAEVMRSQAYLLFYERLPSLL